MTIQDADKIQALATLAAPIAAELVAAHIETNSVTDPLIMLPITMKRHDIIEEALIVYRDWLRDCPPKPDQKETFAEIEVILRELGSTA